MYDFSSLEGLNVAITGGAGFIGHNLALKLKQNKVNVHVIDGLQVNNLGFYTTGYTDNPDAETYISFINQRLSLLKKAMIPLHIVDLRDYHTVCRTLDRIKPDVIIHMAAVAHANRSNKDPFSTFDHSFRTLENVLDAERNKGTQIIYFSSSMVYGNFDGQSVSEERNCEPLGIYGALKYGSEKLIIGYSQVFELPYTIIRPSALYGERCVSRRVGQAFIENALKNQPLTVNGDGKESLDFTYIEDFTDGVMLAINNPDAMNQTFNLTYGSAQPINTMANLVLENFPGAKVEYKQRDDLMPERGTLSIQKAKNLLGYNPQYPLIKGFQSYIDWYKSFSADNPSLFN